MFSNILKDSAPTAFGYIPLGMAFGMLLQGLGFHWIWATIMGTFVFAGAAQFLAITLFSQNAEPSEFFCATLLLNIRHIFYGIAVQKTYSFRGIKKLYTIFSLTDETFSLVTGDKFRNKNEDWILGISALNHLWWVIGCSIGAGIKTVFAVDTLGMEFSLTSLFIALIIEKMRKIINLKSILTGFLIGIALALFYNGNHFILVGIISSLPVLFIERNGRKT